MNIKAEKLDKNRDNERQRQRERMQKSQIDIEIEEMRVKPQSLHNFALRVFSGGVRTRINNGH